MTAMLQGFDFSSLLEQTPQSFVSNADNSMADIL